MNDIEREEVDRLLHDDLSDAEREALLKRLETDPEAVKFLAEQALLVADLTQSLKRRKLSLQISAAIPAVRIAPRNWFSHRVKWIAGAAAAIFLTLGAMIWNRYSDGTAVWVEIVQAEAAMPVEVWQVGKRVRMHSVSLDSGKVGLRLQNGVILMLEGPSQAELVSESRVHLTRGNATADVGKSGKGFIVETDNAKIVDLGTRFGVSAGASHDTDIMVFEGKVEVSDPAEKSARPSTITLTEGEGVRMNDARKPQRLHMVTFGADSNSLGGDVSSGLISDVKDNIAVGTRRYYGLLRGGMCEGARLYTTGHTRTWHAMPNETFPQKLAGADVICTFSTDRHEDNLEITVAVTRPCDLYVFPEAQAPVPGWLKRDFMDTGLRIRSGPWIARGMSPDALSPVEEAKAYVIHSVWKKTIQQAGPVVLGTPRAADRVSVHAMYGIAVKATP